MSIDTCRCFGLHMNDVLHIPLSAPSNFLDEFLSNFLRYYLVECTNDLFILKKLKTPKGGLQETRTCVPPSNVLKSTGSIYKDVI